MNKAILVKFLTQPDLGRRKEKLAANEPAEAERNPFLSGLSCGLEPLLIAESILCLFYKNLHEENLKIKI